MNPEALAEPVGQLVERMQSLPLEVHGVVGLAMVAGLLMWAWGWKVLKPMTVVVSALAGSYAASLAAPSLGLAENVKIEAIVLAGFAFGALGGLLVYRSAMALGCGVVVAVAAPLVSSVVLEPEPVEEKALAQDEQYLSGVEVVAAEGASGAIESAGRSWMDAEIRELMRGAAAAGRASATWAGPDSAEADGGASVRAAWTETGDPETADVDETAADGASASETDGEGEEEDQSAAGQLKRFVRAVAAEAEVQWSKLPERHRFVYGTTAIAGLAVGVMIGLVLPGRASAAVTALFGAAVWLPSFVWLSGAWAMPWRDALGRLDGQGWLIVWCSASLVGLALQWRGMRRARGRSRSRGGDGEEG